jgi:hypothetical protein
MPAEIEEDKFEWPDLSNYYRPSKPVIDEKKMPAWEIALCAFLLVVILGTVIVLGMEYDRFVEAASIISGR